MQFKLEMLEAQLKAQGEEIEKALDKDPMAGRRELMQQEASRKAREALKQLGPGGASPGLSVRAWQTLRHDDIRAAFYDGTVKSVNDVTGVLAGQLSGPSRPQSASRARRSDLGGQQADPAVASVPLAAASRQQQRRVSSPGGFSSADAAGAALVGGHRPSSSGSSTPRQSLTASGRRRASSASTVSSPRGEQAARPAWSGSLSVATMADRETKRRARLEALARGREYQLQAAARLRRRSRSSADLSAADAAGASLVTLSDLDQDVSTLVSVNGARERCLG